MDIEGIPEFFSERSIFITGASGFMGKLLLEKLLRSCPDIGKIYVIIRSHKNQTPLERWKVVTESPVFDRLKSERPGSLESKVEVLEGDMTQIQLGLSAENYTLLQENVSLIFHVAASVRFNDPLPDAVLINLRGTLEVIKLALGCKNLKVLVHVSTTFCNCYQTKTEEKLYPPPADWRKTIEISEKLDKRQLSILGPKYIGVFPNTYTFTKNLAEALVWDYRDKLRSIIMRPSIVISSVKEPIPGWIDNINGPIGLLLAGGKGILRISYVNAEAVPDYMAADIAIKAIIVAAWKRSQDLPDCEVPVLNMATPEKGVTNGELIRMGIQVSDKYPANNMLWYPSSRCTDNKTWFRINAIFVHLLPALIVDLILIIMGKKPLLTKIQQRVHTAMLALGYFTTKPWVFPNKKFNDLRVQILPKDKEDFDYYYADVDVMAYYTNSVKIAKKILLKEDEKVLPQALRHAKRMYWLDKISGLAVKLLLVWFGYKYIFSFM